MTGYQGVHAAAITPRGKQGDIDLGAAFELIDHLCAAGVHGIALFTDCGEYPAFTSEERSRLVYLAAKRSRVPVLVGVGSATLDQSVGLARESREAGAAGLLLPPPFFFQYDADDLVEFYRRFAVQSECGRETLIVNTPAWTSPIPVEVIIELLHEGMFAGAQDSSGSADSLHCLHAATALHGFSLLVGSDSLFTRARCTRGSAMGDDSRPGAVSAAACAVPELVMGLDRAIAAGRQTEIEQLDRMLQEFLEWEGQFPKPTVVKVAAGLRGLKTGPVSVPLSAGKTRRLDEFREWFQAWFPAVKKMSAHV